MLKLQKQSNSHLTPICHQSNKIDTSDSDPGYKSKYKMPSTFKLYPRKDRPRKDGTCALFLSITISGQRIRTSVDLHVDPKKWDAKTQQLKGRTDQIKDLNLVIRKIKSHINSIIVEFRLSGNPLTKDIFLDKLHQKDHLVNFIVWFDRELESQEGLIENSTLRQQRATWRKIKRFAPDLMFHDIDHIFLEQFIKHMKINLGNAQNTVWSTVKNLRKYLNRAKAQGIKFPLDTTKMGVKKIPSDRVNLTIEEVRILANLYESKTLTPGLQGTLQRFLFSCCTGLRLGDNLALRWDNFENGYVFLRNKKGKKIQKLKLSHAACKYLNSTDHDEPFLNVKSQHVTRKQVKAIMVKAGIKKDVVFHTSRHTFATIFLELGGNVAALQKILGHSNIRETMIYVHLSGVILGDSMDLLNAV